MAVQLISKAAYARHRGCDEKAVRKAISEGRISTIDGKIDQAVADIQWAQNTRARADSMRPAAPNGGTGADAAPGAINASKSPDSQTQAPAGGYTDYRTIREKADAEMAQRANLKDAGMLVDRLSVERAIFDVVRSFRDAVMSIGQRAAPKCIGMGDARDIEHVITEEMRKGLENFEARMLERLPAKETV